MIKEVFFRFPWRNYSNSFRLFNLSYDYRSTTERWITFSLFNFELVFIVKRGTK